MEQSGGLFSEILEEALWSSREAGPDPAPDFVDAFKESMRRLAAGVCAVTVEQGGETLGFTATSVTSLSMEPPSVLVSVRAVSRMLTVLRKKHRFTVHLLSEGQAHAANALAGRLGEGVRIASLSSLRQSAYDDKDRTALGRIECRIVKFVPVFSHVLLVGVVEDVRLGPGKRPLVYFDGSFRGLGKIA